MKSVDKSKIQKFAILPHDFSVQTDELTPTFKLKRPQLLKRYQEVIDAMYVKLGEDPSKYKKV